MAERANIPLTESWHRIDWSNYDTDQAFTNGNQMGRSAGPAPNNFSLSTQEHIDIRTFNAPLNGITNSILNPSFEHDTTGNAPIAWAINSSTTFAVQTGWSSYGSKSLRITTSVPASASNVLNPITAHSNGPVTNTFAVSAGQKVAVRADYNVVAIAANMNIGLGPAWYDVNGTFLSLNSSLTAPSTTGTGSWGDIYTAPANATGFFLAWNFNNFAASSQTIDMYLDSVMVVVGSSLIPSYFDGDTPGYLWTGTPGDSSSQTDLTTFAATSEQWTSSPAGSFSAGRQASFNNWLGLQANLALGTTTTFSSTISPIDLTQIPGASISLALPNFSTSLINTSSSSLQLSDGTNTATLPFNTSTTPLVTGNTTATWPISAVTGVDLTSIITVNLVIHAANTTTFTAMALRLIGPNWIVSSMDFDSVNGILRETIPLNGDPSAQPVASNQKLPTLWRSALVPGVDDPRPIDSEFGITFNTGSQLHNNAFTLYLRQVSEAFITQLDLEGSSQAQLTGQPQPTGGVSQYAPRTMADLEKYTMAQLESDTMLSLERTNDPVYDGWISFTVQWGVAPNIRITSSANPSGGYSFTPPTFASDTPYVAIINLTGSNARLQLYSLTPSNQLNVLVFDSQVIPDSFVFPRRAGRVGFFASLNDGDSYIQAIRPRSLNFAQYISKPLQSITPVKGAQLYVQSSPDINLFSGESNLVPLADSNDNAPLLYSDSTRFYDGDEDATSIRVQMTTPSVGAPGQGVVTSLLTPSDDAYSGITDFANLEINMAIWLPSAAIPAADLTTAGDSTITSTPMIAATLVHPNGASYPLDLPPIIPDQWTEISIKQPLAYPWPLSGLYELQVGYIGPLAATWWIDGLSVVEKSVIWDARSVVSDPWSSNYAPWTPFHDTLNSQYSGAHFPLVGNNLQVRATATKQNAAIIASPQVIPQYATLGRLVWPEDQPSYSALGVPTFNVYSTGGRSYTFGYPSLVAPNNLTLNPNFEHDTVGSPPAAWQTPVTAGGAVVTTNAVQTGWSHSGTKSWRLTATMPANSSVIINGATPTSTPFSPGWNIGTSAYANVLSITGMDVVHSMIAPGYIVWNSTGGLVDAGGPGMSTAGIQSTSSVTTGAFSSGAFVAAQLYFANYGTTTGTMDFYLDNIIVSGGTFTGSPLAIGWHASYYVDGDTIGYQWSGTPGNSTTQKAPYNASPGLGNFYWSFGDGTYGVGQTTSHTYPSSAPTGTQYTVTMTYVDATGRSISSSPYTVTVT